MKPIANLPPPPLPQPLTPIATPTPEVLGPSTEPAPVAGTSRLSSPGTAELQAQIEALSNSGGGTARVRLNPPHLGEVDIQVRMRGERVEVQIQTEEIAARSALLDAAPALLDTLASKSFRVEQFDVTLRDPANDPSGSRGSGTDPREGGARRDQAEPDAGASSRRSEGQLIERPGPWHAPAQIESPGGIDLRV